MISTQQKLIELCGVLERIAKDCDLPETCAENAESLKNKIAARNLVVPVVGAFSAGKSTLLNACIEKQILPEAITPETALATELHYSEKEYIEAVDTDGKITRYETSGIESLKADAARYQYARLYLNSPALREIEPLVLVDMPGFDSPLDNHNKAILAYLARGAYYIVLDSGAESKTPSASLVRRLREIETLERRFSFFVSKTNMLGSQAEIDAVTAHYKSVLERELKHTVEVQPLGICSGKEIIHLLSSIDAGALFVDIYRGRFNALCDDIIDLITLRINAGQKNEEENKALILSMQNSITSIEQKAEKMIADIEERYASVAVNDIVKAVGNDLNDALPELVMLGGKGNQAAVEQTISDIVRASLTGAVKSKFGRLIDEITMDLSSETREVSLLMNNLGESDNFALSLIEKAQSLLNELQLVDTEGSAQGKGVAYHAVSTIMSLMDGMINPLELVFIFLPEILNFFTKGFKENEMRQKFQTEVFPRIKHKIHSEMPAFLNNAIKNIIADVRRQYTEQIEQRRIEVDAAMETAKTSGAEQQKTLEQLTLSRSAVQQIKETGLVR
ncbi:MAG: dynamin family protein [Spirochaetaceae bacterium]|jgi:GTPase Era involved in 16S rRNA processing|nr:dynamin family protein [Spirochaetaceae bacterium]